MAVTEAGTQNEAKVACEKVLDSRDESRVPGSKVTAVRLRQSEKQPEPMCSTLDGTQIDVNPEEAKALFSIRISFEPGSKVTVERAEQRKKQEGPSTSTEEEM
jgi:hypothetical protein